MEFKSLIPLIEGTTVSTKHGTVKTDYILFITSGSFHTSKPSDMLPELQGRLPIRVELESLSKDATSASRLNISDIHETHGLSPFRIEKKHCWERKL